MVLTVVPEKSSRETEEMFSHISGSCDFNPSWLRRRLELSEITSLVEEFTTIASSREDSFARTCESFIAIYSAGDEVWEYSSPRECWNMGMGSSGYAIVRDGNPIATLMTKMN